MNRQPSDGNEAMQAASGSARIVPFGRIRTGAPDGCRGDIEAARGSFHGRETLPGDSSGGTTSDKTYPVDFSHLDIAGRRLGGNDLHEGASGNGDSRASTETTYGLKAKARMRLPLFIGMFGSTEMARSDWQDFVIGAAISGISIVCGENVCGIDPEFELDIRGEQRKAPNMVRCMEEYRRFHKGYGEMIVQMNVENARLGVAEYIVAQLGVECVELNWGRGVGLRGGDIRVDSIGHALEFQRRGYLVTPDPSNPANRAAFENGVLEYFERRSRIGFVDQEGFLKEVERVRRLGAKRVFLRTGVDSKRELALAIEWASDAKLDLLTIGGTPHARGFGRGRRRQQGGVPTFYVQSMAHDLCRELASTDKFVPDMAVADRFRTADPLFKALALGAPFTKAVCMDRDLTNSPTVGGDVGSWLKDGAKALPETTSPFGASVEEIFGCYEGLVAEYGKATAERLPLGAVTLRAFGERLRFGLERLMVAGGHGRVSSIGRDDLMARTPEAARVSGIPCAVDASNSEVERIIKA